MASRRPLQHYQSKPLIGVQTFLSELKTSISLVGEVLTEVKNLTEILEGLFLRLERLFVVFVCLVLTIIGAVTLISWKIDLPHLIERIHKLFQ